MMTELITTTELERQTGIDANTWAKRRLSGDTPQYLKIGRSVRYRWSDVEDWLRAQARTSTSES